MNHRLEALRKAAAVRPGPPAPVAPSPPSGPGSRAAAPDDRRPPARDVYQAAYIDFSKGGYQLAITGFRDFLRRFPDHKLADNAQYWIGESYLALAHSYANAGQQEDKATQALEEAVREFRRVITNYPRGTRCRPPLQGSPRAAGPQEAGRGADAPAVPDRQLPPRRGNAVARDRLTALKP